MPKSLQKNRLGIPVFALVLLFLAPWDLHAQQVVVTGTVKSGPEESVPGATILEKGTDTCYKCFKTRG